MGLFDKVKDMIPEDKDALKDKARDLAGKLDDQAEKMATKDGKLGDLAAKAHEVLDKVDRDPNPPKVAKPKARTPKPTPAPKP